MIYNSEFLELEKYKKTDLEMITIAFFEHKITKHN